MIGSNIEPVENTRQAVTLLNQAVHIDAISASWETQSIGFDGPNFLNTMVRIQTEQDRETLKLNVLTPIEQKLGRVRTSNKNAPRTMDLDVILFDDQVVDPALWRRAHLALPTAELLPDLVFPETGQTLDEISRILAEAAYAVKRPELDFRSGILSRDS
jgi:2-amino-4-hydroxy-6-hydroxymethyldihydropteridine diphosphokinase